MKSNHIAQLIQTVERREQQNNELIEEINQFRGYLFGPKFQNPCEDLINIREVDALLLRLKDIMIQTSYDVQIKRTEEKF